MPKQILLVEDSVTMQKVVEITFAHEDYRITSARDGDEALTRLREVRPDVIIIDAGISGGNAPSGYDVAAALRGEATAREVPLLLLTGNFNPYDEARGQRAGVDTHVVKPFETQVLIDKVADLLRRRTGAGQSNANTLLAIPSPTTGTTQGTPIGALSPSHGGETRRATIPPVPPARPQVTAPAPRAAVIDNRGAAAAHAIDTGLQRSTLMGIPAVNPLGAPGLRPPPPPGMRVRETGNLPAINPPAPGSQSGIFNTPAAAASSTSSSLPSWGARPAEGRAHSGPGGAASAMTSPQGGNSTLAPVTASQSLPAFDRESRLGTAVEGRENRLGAALGDNRGGFAAGDNRGGSALADNRGAGAQVVHAAGIPAGLPQMPRLPLLPRAPLPAAVTAVLERIAQRGAEYEAIAKLSVEVIEQICWEVIPELAEVVLKAEVEKHMQHLQATAALAPPSGQKA